MNTRIVSFLNNYLGKTLEFRVRLFNILAMAGIFVGGLMTVVTLFRGQMLQMSIDALSMLLSVALLIYSRKTGRYQQCYLITIVAIFFGVFTLLFLKAGGYKGGLPFYFVFAVVFTIFMLEGRKALVIASTELIYYTALCMYAYYNPTKIQHYATENTMLVYIIVGFTAVSIVLGITMYMHLKLYADQQRELEEKNAALNAINRLKTEFLADIAHELKTPLSVMSGYAQDGQKALYNHPELQDVQHDIQVINLEAERLAILVNQVLDVSKIEEGQLPFTMQENCLTEIVQKTLNMYAPMLAKNHNKLEFIVKEDIPLVLCDESRIMQVLVNLLSNATNHTKDGTIVLTIKTADNAAKITLADTGTGIAPEQMPFLFERFKTAARKQKAGGGRNTGTGLGLFICKHIVTAHNGLIEIESQSGKGTSVNFTIPLHNAP